MNWIEQLFHLAPDGGTGLTELAILLVCVFVPAAVFVIRKRSRRI
jgi:hypothetical protein